MCGGEATSLKGGPYDTSSGSSFFDLASVTKPMTAMAVALSSLDRGARLGDVLEEARGTASEEASIESLLSHRAGLAAHLRLFEQFASGLRGDASARRAARREALSWVANARRSETEGPFRTGGFPPVYSDLGYWLAGVALARHENVVDAGAAIEARVVSALGCPDELGTARTLTARNVDFAARVVPTEVMVDEGEIRGVVHDENARALSGFGGEGHAGMFGTVRAVLAFGCAACDAIERRRGPLGRSGADPSWLVRPREGGTLRAGFDGKSSEGSSAGTRASMRAYGHLGFTGTSLWIDPDAGIVVTLLTNRVYPTRDNVAIRGARPLVHDALFAMADRARHATPTDARDVRR